MGLFDFFKKKETPEPEEEKSRLVLSMPILRGSEGYDADDILSDLKSHWRLEVSGVSNDGMVCTFEAAGLTVAICLMDAPIPWADLEANFPHNYLWKDASSVLKDHQCHLIVTVFGGKGTALENYQLLSKVNASVMRANKGALGVYQGVQRLMLPNAMYVGLADMMLSGSNPVTLWVYIGITNTEEGPCAFTWGMKEFGRTEMEIIDSPIAGKELFDFMQSIISYTIGYDTKLRDGDTIGFTAHQKIKIREVKGVFNEGYVLRLYL